MKSDADLRRDVIAELAWDPTVRLTATELTVEDGMVALRGHVQACRDRQGVAQALRRVSGVKGIELQLDVILPPADRRTDAEIREAAELAFALRATLPRQGVSFAVRDAWVTLTGEVEWDFERREIEDLVQNLTGVVGVKNKITLLHKPTPVNLTRRIHEALLRRAEEEARELDVAVQGGTVTLRGRVRSWHEVDAALRATWSAPGVRAVINELQVE